MHCHEAENTVTVLEEIAVLISDALLDNMHVYYNTEALYIYHTIVMIWHLFAH